VWGFGAMAPPPKPQSPIPNPQSPISSNMDYLKKIIYKLKSKYVELMTVLNVLIILS